MDENQFGIETTKYQAQTLRLVEQLSERLSDLAGAVGSSGQLDSILQSLVDLIQADFGDLRLLQPNSDQLEPVSSAPVRSDGTPHRPADLALALIELVGRERQPRLVQNYPLWVAEAPYPLESGRPLCALAVPVWIADQFTGVLSLTSNRDPNFFSQADLQVVDLFARLAALALQADLRLQTIQQSAVSDSLTGVWSRSRFFEMAEHAFRQAVRYQRPLAVILIDIDRFKMLNEMHGYGVGDQVLETVARNIVSRLRDSDLLGRYGGEEFVLLLPETDLEHARLAADRMRSQIAAAPTETRKGTFFVTISAGVASLESAAVDQLEELLDMAEQAMRSAKLAGRNQVALYTQGEEI